MLGQLRHRLLDVHRVARVDDRQVGHPAEDRDVLGGLMRRSVSGGQPGKAADDVHVEVRLGDVEADEVVCATGREHGVGGRERHQAGLGHPRGRTEQQLLGHAHLEEPVRILPGEDVHVGVLAEIRGHPDDALVGPRGLHESVPERCRRGLLAGVGERRDHRRSLQWCNGCHTSAPSWPAVS